MGGGIRKAKVVVFLAPHHFVRGKEVVWFPVDFIQNGKRIKVT